MAWVRQRVDRRAQDRRTRSLGLGLKEVPAKTGHAVRLSSSGPNPRLGRPRQLGTLATHYPDHQYSRDHRKTLKHTPR